MQIANHAEVQQCGIAAGEAGAAGGAGPGAAGDGCCCGAALPASAQKMAFLCLPSPGQNNSPFSQDPQKDLGSLQLTDFLGSSSTEGEAKSLSGFGDLAHGCEVAVGRC